MDNTNIKNLIFDVGSVLIGYRWRDMFKDHGVEEEKALKIGRGIFDCEDWKLFDSGLIDSNVLIDNFCKRFPELEEEARWFIDNAILMRVLRPRVYEELTRLKEKGYKLYILSNYSKELFELHTGDLPFRKMMDGELVSYMVNDLKPNDGIYEALIERFNINPEESVFFDDRLENAKAAEKFGIRGVHIENESEELLLKYLKEF